MRGSPQKKLEKERVRGELMRAMLRLAARHGFASLGLREVSREAGIAPTSFYRHFGDVEELGIGVIRELVAPAIDAVVERALECQAQSRSASARAMVEGLLDATLDDPDLVRFVIAGRVSANPVIRAHLRGELAKLAPPLAAALPATAPDGTAEVAVAALLDACDALIQEEPEVRADLRAPTLKRTVATIDWMTGPGPTDAGES